MKTIKICSFAFWLLLSALNLSAQNHAAISAEVIVNGSMGNYSDDQCQAGFSATPDSLTSYPFYYHFKDLSTGNINAWYWDFGDGSTSLEQNPSHQYNGAGNFKVCLSVADLNDTSNCSDQACQYIATLEYFSLGGLAYAGEYPLNNPVMVGDTGIASLYRIVDQQIVFVEDHFFQEYGYYWFGYLFPGEYMVKVGLTKGSPHYNDYFTTYFGDDISWTKADLLKISTSDIYAADIHLLPVQVLSAGQGIIRGYVNFEQGSEFSMPPISQTTVILADNNHIPLQFTRPNPAGYFEFTGIPYESYYLSADATGKPSSTVIITLSETSPVVEGINLTVFGGNASYIPEGYENGISLTSIYPNPVMEDLHLKVYSGTSTPADIRVTDATGRIYYAHTEILASGFSQIIVPAATLSPGLYILTVQPLGSYLPASAKFIK